MKKQILSIASALLVMLVSVSPSLLDRATAVTPNTEIQSKELASAFKILPNNQIEQEIKTVQTTVTVKEVLPESKIQANYKSRKRPRPRRPCGRRC